MQALFIILAAICKAFADAQAHHGYMVRKHWFWSVDRGPLIPFTKYRPNSWHIANSIMITSFLTGIFYNDPNPVLCVAVSGTLFLIFFNTLYNKIFK